MPLPKRKNFIEEKGAIIFKIPRHLLKKIQTI